MNKVIICIPTYNRTEQINSLFKDLSKQEDQKFSVVILNDGANADTKKILQNKNPAFKFYLFESSRPSGLPCARNKILDFIKRNKIDNNGTFVAFLDDDLIIDKNFISQIKKYSEKFDGFCFRIIQRGSATTFDFTKNEALKKIFSPLIGTISPFFGFFFGGYYIKTNKIVKIDHLNGGCLIYNFSKNKNERFDLSLNEGNFVAEDTCFSYGLKLKGNDLRFIGNYSYIHNPPDTGGCRIEDKKESFYWYWKHKLYIFKKYHGFPILLLALFFSFLESIILSIIFKTNLIEKYIKATKTYAKNFSHNGCLE
ncbi:MAG: glycosyltransferase family 2 protein [Candidatus Moranbacteria bacterium]|jgi:glycosyltransferase involved in cell wall biosynthesis|nr:glycosyltransferase family 2 protein [Candidatus Moranbacteria bacterium]